MDSSKNTPVTSITIPKDLLAQLTGHLVWLENSKHQIVFWSPECAALFGYSSQQILGKPAPQICSDSAGDGRRRVDGRELIVNSVSLQLSDESGTLTCHIDFPQADASDFLQHLPLPAALLRSSSVITNSSWQQLFSEWNGPSPTVANWLRQRFPADFGDFLSTPEKHTGTSWVGPLHKADGTTCPVEVWSRQTPQGQLLIANNITEQSKQIDALIDENQRIRLALTSTQLGIWDWQTGQDIVQFSPELNQMLGFPAHWSECNFDGFLDIFVEDEHKQILDYLESHLSVGTPFDLTCRIKSRTGEIRWMRLCGQCLRDSQGNPVRMSGSLSDISDYKQTIDALKSSDTQLSTAQHVARLGNWEWSVADNSMHWSEAMYALHGVPSGRIQPDLETYIRLVYAPDQAELRQALLKAIKTKDEISAEYRVTHRDGRLIDIWLTCYPHISAHGELKSLFGTAQDISERKRVERQIAGEKKILEMIAGSRELSESLGTLCRVIEEQLIGAMACVQLLDEHSSLLYYIAAPSLPAEFIQGSQNWLATPY